MTRLDLPSAPRVLVVVLQRLGDVLLTTPLIRSIACAWPDAAIDVLAFADTAGILVGNPDIRKVITMPRRSSVWEGLSIAARMWNRYDLAVSTQAGDRPTFFAFAAGRKRVGPVQSRLSGLVTRLALHRHIPFDASSHRVRQMSALASLLDIAPIEEVVVPRASVTVTADAPYAVIHAAPLFRYKQWSRDGWRGLATELAGRGLAVIATGGPQDRERRYLDAIWSGMETVRRVDGTLDWAQTATLLEGARLYVGPDTSVTHLAAAAGCPTVALFGPTDPALWGPWPTGAAASWSRRGPLQRQGNVWLVQQLLPCTPCHLEGCERRLDSYSRCLDEMPLRAVLAAADLALAEGGVRAQTPV